nr:uncharacterized protein LOC127329518 [Lolium perenne]
MSRRLKTTYSMLGLNGRTMHPPPPQPQPEPEPEPQANADYSTDEDVDPWFAAWDEVHVTAAEEEAAEEAAEEVAQSGQPPQAPAHPDQVAILASLKVERYHQRLKEERDEFINDANLQHDLEISCQRAATEEVARHAEIHASRERMEARGHRRRQAPVTPVAMLHRQMHEAREEKRARTQAAMTKNDDEAGPSSGPTDGQ